MNNMNTTIYEYFLFPVILNFWIMKNSPLKKVY